MRLFVHDGDRIRRLLACTTLDEQRAFYEREWNGWRWRGLFTLLMNRLAFRRAYDPAFSRHVENPSFAAHFHALAEHALTEIPVADNYFLHHMLTGVFPVARPNGVPPYLSTTGAARAGAAVGYDRLTLLDGAVTGHLLTLPASSACGLALSDMRAAPGPRH